MVRRMKPWVQLEESKTPDGTVLALWQRGTEMVIRADGQPLMGNRCQASEVALSDLALEQLGERPGARVLVGGLGFGYTLRAALDRLPAKATVVVAELSATVVRWNRGPLREFAGQPLSDPRVEVHQGDIVALLRSPKASFDVILLDVDNGPRAFTQGSNAWLYTQGGLVRIAQTLRPGGVLAVWSAGVDGTFIGQLRASGYEATAHRVRARINDKGEGKGERHMIWTATPRRKKVVEHPARPRPAETDSQAPRSVHRPPRRPTRQG